ncbi:MAG: urea transport system permease protein, partial [Actinomycetota bacterium]
STLSEKFPNNWVYFQGALFIVVVLLLPGGVASLGSKLKGLRLRRPSVNSATAPATEVEAAA